MTDSWAELSRHVAAALAGGADGPVLEAEVDATVGATTLDVLVESTGGDAADQELDIAALCDLLATRLNEGFDHVMGCLLIDGEPDATAFARGLHGMRRADGTFTPVLPLSIDQGKALVAAAAPLLQFTNDAAALVEIAASRPTITTDVAATALAEIDELVSRAEIR